MGKKKDKKKLKDVANMVHAPIGERDIADISEEWLKIFGGNVNVSRIAPNAIDGLKPVARRMLYALHKNPNKGMKFRKVQRAAADTIAYHPHGDTAVSDVIYNMGASWKQNLMLVDSQGNFGNIRGDSAAHPRYPEVKLSKAAEYIYFSDLKFSNVPMRSSYDGDDVEPDYLPARIPVVLCNPQFSGIGIGVATNIPPFNVSEVIKATIKLIKDPNAKILLIPDSPTGCEIVDEGQFAKMNEIGDDCKLTMRSTYEIDYMSNIITITSLPLQVTVDQVVQSIVALRKSGKLDDLIDIADHTAKDEVDLKLYLKTSVNPDKFVEQIMAKKTGLKKTYPVEIRVIDDFQPHVWGTKELLLEWIEYRRECVRAIYNKRLMDTLSDQHMNEVFMMVFKEDNIKKTLEIAKTSKNREDMEERFMKTYGITTLQARTLSKMGVYQFTKDAYKGYKEKKIECEKQVKEFTDILEDDDAVDRIIVEQLEEANKLFGQPRKSPVVKAGKMKEKIPDTRHLIGISKDGYIKKISVEDSKSIGTVGKSSQVIVTVISNRDNLIIFDSSGRISRVGVSSIPDMDYEDIGVELTRYFTINGFPVSIINEMDIKDASGDIILVTEKGIGKKVKLSEFSKIKDFKEAIQLNDGDQLISAIPSGDEEFIIYTDFGDGIRLRTTDIKRQSKNAKGLSLISLRANEKVVGIDFLSEGCDKLIYITSSGRMKLTEGKYLPVMNRRDEPVSLIALEKNEYLIGVGFVSKKDQVVVYRKKSEPVTVALKDIPITSRIAKAEKLVKTPHGDIVTGFKIIRG